MANLALCLFLSGLRETTHSRSAYAAYQRTQTLAAEQEPAVMITASGANATVAVRTVSW